MKPVLDTEHELEWKPFSRDWMHMNASSLELWVDDWSVESKLVKPEGSKQVI